MKESVYLEFTTTYMMQGCDYLYSGGENDPIENAKLHAMEFLAKDNGQVYPFVIDVGMPAQDVDRSEGFLEDKGKEYVRWDSKITVTVKVFKDVRGYNDYLTSEYINSYGKES